MRKVLSLILVLLLPILIFGCNNNTIFIKGKRVDIISEKNNNTNWKELYFKQLQNVNDMIYQSFSLIFVDNDGIPEMLFQSRSHVTTSKLFWVYDNEIYYLDISYNGFYYYEKQNLFMNSDGFTGTGWDTIYRIYLNKAENVCEGNYCLVKGHETFKINDSIFETYEQYINVRNDLFDTRKASFPNEQLSLIEIKNAIKDY